MAEVSPSRLSIDVSLDRPAFGLAVSFEVDNRGVTGLFGPSGSGKSTLLRVIAGLEDTARGTVRFGDATWQASASGTFVPACERPVGFVFQNARLFPHLSVAGNLEYADSRSDPSSDAIRFDDVVQALDLRPLLARDVTTLSGGERQRVAIGRALLCRPRLMLFDEPVAALDTARKRGILPYIEALPRRFGIPAIYVSHSASEMARLADRILILEAGRISADGPAQRILGRDGLRDSGMAFEAVTILDVDIVEHLADVGLTRVRYADHLLTAPQMHGIEPGDTARLVVRAGDVVIATGQPGNLSVRNRLPGRVSAIEASTDSAFAMVSVDIGGAVLKAQLTRHAVTELGLARGSEVCALVKTASFERNS